MKSKIYIRDKKIGKMTKKIKRKAKIPVSRQRYTLNDVTVRSRFFEMILIALELNK